MQKLQSIKAFSNKDHNRHSVILPRGMGQGATFGKLLKLFEIVGNAELGDWELF
jgi:hypothetical protein